MNGSDERRPYRLSALLRVSPLLALGLALGCSSQSLTVDDAGPGPGDATAATSTLPCPQTIAQFCAQPDPASDLFVARCDAQLAAARSDQRLCGGLGGEQACGSYEVVVAAGIDSGYRYYYARASGASLVAVVSYAFPRGDSCVAGPSQFVVPASSECTNAGRLPACP